MGIGRHGYHILGVALQNGVGYSAVVWSLKSVWDLHEVITWIDLAMLNER
jgi:hypothetical protein